MAAPLPITLTEPFRRALAAADADLRVRQAKLYIVLCLVLVPACAALDYFVYPHLLGRIFVGRVLCDAAMVPALVALFTRRGRAWATPLCWVIPLFPAGTICWMIAASEGVVSPYYAGINLCLVGVTLLIPYTLAEASALCGVVVAFYAVACAAHGTAHAGAAAHATRSTVANNVTFLLATITIALAACHYTCRRRVEEFRLRYELDANNRELAATLAKLQETEVQLVQSEKMNALGKLSAGLLHEINNPLNYTVMALQVAEQDAAGDPVMLDTLKDIGEGMARIRTVITDLRAFAYPTAASATEEFKLADAVKSALRLTTQELGGITVDTAAVGDATALGGSTQVAHVLMNLLVNAAHAVKAKFPAEGGRITVACGPSAGGTRLDVTVRDNGCGVPPENLPKLTNPFFTTKEKGKGMGLGLSICHTIVKNHGGRVRAASEVGQWTEMTFDLGLPAAVPAFTGGVPDERSTDASDRRAA